MLSTAADVAVVSPSACWLSGSAVAHGCRSLTKLNMHGCVKITDMGLQALSNRPINESFANLETIDISACPKLGDAGILALLHGCSTLTSLNMSDNRRVSACST
jgi:hypothetical protein